jgi:hypothetical protein
MGTPPQPVPFSTLRDGDLFQWPGGTTARQRVDRTHYRSYPDVGGAGHDPVRPLNAADTWVVPLRRWEPIRLDALDPNATATQAETAWRTTPTCPVCGGQPDDYQYEPDEEQKPLHYPAIFQVCRVCMSPLLIPTENPNG